MPVKFLETEFLDNEIIDYLIALIILIAASLVVRLLCRFVFQRLKKWTNKTPTLLDDRLIAILEKHTIPVVYLGSV